MSLAELIPLVAALSALISAIAAAFWGRAMAAAKNETIRAKDAELEALRTIQDAIAQARQSQIDALRQQVIVYQDLAPNKIREYFLSMKAQLEDYNDLLQAKLADAQETILSKDEQLAQLEAASQLQQISIESELASANTVTLEGLARATEIREGAAEGHTHRVTEMTIQLAKAMGLPNDQVANIKRGALLHDFGKIVVPDSILRKPGPLSEEEWAILREHPSKAVELLSPIEYLRPALDIPRAHHENWDGSGYPHGLKGEQIPLAARIFAVVDVWDTLQTDRPYRKAYPLEKILEFIQLGAGKRFDPRVAAEFESLVRRHAPQ